MKILICGSRGWQDDLPIAAIIAGHKIKATTDLDSEGLTVIHGHARSGADAKADFIARQWGVKVIRVPAEWDRYGKAAGPKRNQKMVDDHKPDVVYAFRAAGRSHGTDDMVRRAQAAGITTYVITQGVTQDA